MAKSSAKSAGRNGSARGPRQPKGSVTDQIAARFDAGREALAEVATMVQGVIERREAAQESNRQLTGMLADMGLNWEDGRPEKWPDGVPPSRGRVAVAAPAPAAVAVTPAAPAEDGVRVVNPPAGGDKKVTQNQFILDYCQQNGGGFQIAELSKAYHDQTGKTGKLQNEIHRMHTTTKQLEKLGDGYYRLKGSKFKKPA